jgi:hypothetical protein
MTEVKPQLDCKSGSQVWVEMDGKVARITRPAGGGVTCTFQGVVIKSALGLQFAGMSKLVAQIFRRFFFRISNVELLLVGPNDVRIIGIPVVSNHSYVLRRSDTLKVDCSDNNSHEK